MASPVGLRCEMSKLPFPIFFFFSFFLFFYFLFPSYLLPSFLSLPYPFTSPSNSPPACCHRTPACSDPPRFTSPSDSLPILHGSQPIAARLHAARCLHGSCPARLPAHLRAGQLAQLARTPQIRPALAKPASTPALCSCRGGPTSLT
jgi:hypothetical protein